jgi:hypothetical protein
VMHWARFGAPLGGWNFASISQSGPSDTVRYIRASCGAARPRRPARDVARAGRSRRRGEIYPPGLEEEPTATSPSRGDRIRRACFWSKTSKPHAELDAQLLHAAAS